MDGIILINKDKDMTSREVVNVLQKEFNQKKIGHFGTLDPLATGLLVIGLGSYTKSQCLFSNEDKEYEVEVLLGKSTDTYDITGNVIKEKDIVIEEDDLIKNLLSFKGNYMQEVPIYSAVKIEGKKLYEYARENIKVTLPKKMITIFDINFISLYEKEGNKYFSFSCHVSKGTYIRSLINDLGLKTNIPMCMSNLKRTKCGDFSIDNSYTLEDVNNNKYKIITVRDFLDIEVKEIPKDDEKCILNGTEIDKFTNKYVLFTKDNEDISLYGSFNDKMKPYLTFKK